MFRPVSALFKSKGVSNLIAGNISKSVSKPNRYHFSTDKTKKTNFTHSQEAFNFLSRIGGFEEIGDLPCTQSIVLNRTKEYLQQKQHVQVPNCCLFEVGLITDVLKGGNSEFFSLKALKGTTSFTKGEKRDFSGSDVELAYYIASHIKSNDTELDQTTTIGFTDFFKQHVGHKIFREVYLSAKDLEVQLRSTSNPVHTFCLWGDGEDKRGYGGHSILIYGIDVDQKVHYYDVSDKLDTTKFSRFRTMDIQELNDRRRISGESKWLRIPVFYKE